MLLADCRLPLPSEPPPVAVRVCSLQPRAEAALVMPRYAYRDAASRGGRVRRATRVVRMGRAMAAIGKTWAPLLLAGIVWAFAWIYAQLPPAGETAVAVQAEPRPASSAGPIARNPGPASAEVRSKQIENPISDGTAVRAREDTGLVRDSRGDAAEILSVQPVTSIDLTANWKPITLILPPLVGGVSAPPDPHVPSDRGVVTISVFLSPHKPNDAWLSGTGRIAQATPVAHKIPDLDAWGFDAWGVGAASFVAGPIVAGSSASRATSTGGMSGHGVPRTGLFSVNPFAHYDFGDGWFMSSAPIIAANQLPNGINWTLPVGAEVGRVVKIGDTLPVNLFVGTYYDALRPQFGARWQIRTEAAFIF